MPEYEIPCATTLKIRAIIKKMNDRQKSELIEDVVRACYYTDQGWDRDGDINGGDLVCSVLDALGPYEFVDAIPEKEEDDGE